MGSGSFLPSLVVALLTVCGLGAQTWGQSSSTSKQVKKTAVEPALEAGSVSNGVYRNKSLGITCKIPAGWVLRTDEMNLQDDAEQDKSKPQRTQRGTEDKLGRVLLGAFSRPPEAHGEDVNSSILIVAESVAAYPGMKDAAQYFGPLSEVAKAQGFEVVNEPYDFLVGLKTVARGDFEKASGTRVMRQSTLAILAKGYAVSFTFIGGSQDEVEELIEGLGLTGGAPTKK